MRLAPQLPPLCCLALTLLAACSSPRADRGELGGLELGLTTQAGGVSYRLRSARFTLEGPEPREFSAPDEVERLELELPQGAYRLTLHEGFTLARGDLPDAGPMPASLVSSNPAPVTISAGQTTRVALRFELRGDDPPTPGQGTLQVGVEVVSGDAGSGGAPGGCQDGLKLDEVDYEQANSDDAEFIELVNAGVCPAPLADVSVELVNGSDGRTYARYPLAALAESLPVGGRIVLADPALISALPSGTLSAPLNGAGMQNGPDGVRIVAGDRVLDALAYEGAVMGASEGQPAPADEGEASLVRCPDGFDSDDNARDFRLVAPSPGATNVCD